MNPLYLSSSSTLPLDVGGIVQWSPWGLMVVALLGLSGCVPTDRGWVQEQLAVRLRYLPEPLAYRTLSTRWASRHKVAPWKVCHKDY
jgi:hypothetical protein